MALCKCFVFISIALLLLSELALDIALEYVSTCSIEPSKVAVGENATLTCDLTGEFSVNGVKIQRTELNKTHQIDDVMVLECTLYEGSETFSCSENLDGYLPINNSRNPFGVRIVNASTKHEGSYVCAPVPGSAFDVRPCKFTLSDKRDESNTEISKWITIGVLLGAGVVLVVAVVVFVFVRQKRQQMDRGNRRRQKKEDYSGRSDSSCCPCLQKAENDNTEEI